MSSNTTPGTVHEAVLAVMDEIGRDGIGKSGWNDHSKYKYRAIEDVLAAFNRAMVKHRLTISHEKLSHETERVGKNTYVTVDMRYTFTGPDGSTLTQVYGGCGGDVGDKAMAKAQTNAYKYMLTTVFNIPVEGMADGDATTLDRSEAEEKEQRERLAYERAWESARDELLAVCRRKGMDADDVVEWWGREYGSHPKDAPLDALRRTAQSMARDLSREIDTGSPGPVRERPVGSENHPAGRKQPPPQVEGGSVTRLDIPGQRKNTN